MKNWKFLDFERPMAVINAERCRSSNVSAKLDDLGMEMRATIGNTEFCQLVHGAGFAYYLLAVVIWFA
ncbi:MAG: hypothetical protein KDN22_08730 [Verrucomicrobiae bacterium]|nr:hypothetical protein [Verrucomicrobiae bacterium]